MGEEVIILVPVANPKPFVQLACVCEKALTEPDSVISLIRIVDTYLLDETPPALPPGVGVALPLTIIVSLKSGEVTGEHEVGLTLVGPDGKTNPIHKWPLVFNGEEHGANLNIAFALQAPKYGLYWFEVVFEDEVLTRIPLRVKPKTVAGVIESNESAMSLQ